MSPLVNGLPSVTSFPAEIGVAAIFLVKRHAQNALLIQSIGYVSFIVAGCRDRRAIKTRRGGRV